LPPSSKTPSGSSVWRRFLLSTGLIPAWLGALALAAPADPPAPSAGLDALKRIYEQESAKIVAEQRASLDALPHAYANALDALAKQLQSAGDLEGLVAVRDELARFVAQSNVAAGCVVTMPERLRNLQLDQIKRIAAVDVTRREKGVALIAKYLAALNTLKKNLTREQKIDDAMKVRAEIERVTAEQYFLTNPPDGPPLPVADETGAPPVATPPGKTEQPSSTPPQNKLARDTVLYYSFDRDGDGEVRDDSGNGRHGTVRDARFAAKGRRGGAYDFDGRTSNIVTPALDTTGDMTWSVWFCPRSYPVAHDTFGQIIGLRGHAWVWNSDNTSVGFASRTADPDRGLFLYFIVQGQRTTPIHRFVNPPELNAWHHVAAVINAEGNHLYLDGKLLVTAKPPTRFGSAAALIIGANDNGPQRFFDGLIDEVMVFDRALSVNEIRGLYRER
jgi:hypothetical protein